jgi:RimJ/RimL family protein N-acetyltransferase
MELRPLTLSGAHARLVPLAREHAEGLWRATANTEIWTWMPFRIRSVGEMAAFIDRAIALAEQNAGLGFAIFAPDEAEPIGSTGYWNADHQHRRVEIGATWLTSRWQRTAINTECKLLLLRHAFEALGCVRVEFKTDATNTRARVALKRIGATEEGTLRRHMVMPDGRLRDSVYYSILDREWPEISRRLARLSARHGPAARGSQQ